jgi:hypothetical protein
MSVSAASHSAPGTTVTTISPMAPTVRSSQAIENAHLTNEEQGFYDGAPGGDRIEWADVPRRFTRLWGSAGDRDDS